MTAFALPLFFSAKSFSFLRFYVLLFFNKVFVFSSLTMQLSMCFQQPSVVPVFQRQLRYNTTIKNDCQLFFAIFYIFFSTFFRLFFPPNANKPLPFIGCIGLVPPVCLLFGKIQRLSQGSSRTRHRRLCHIGMSRSLFRFIKGKQLTIHMIFL